MLKNKTIVHVHVNGKDYEFYCDPDSHLNDALEANMQINAFLLGRQQQQLQQAQTQAEPEKPFEQLPEPVAEAKSE